MEVRLLSKSEAMLLEAGIFCLEDFLEGGGLSSVLVVGCCPSHSFSETHTQTVAVSYSKGFFKKYFEGERIVDEIRILSIKTIC